MSLDRDKMSERYRDGYRVGFNEALKYIREYQKDNQRAIPLINSFIEDITEYIITRYNQYPLIKPIEPVISAASIESVVVTVGDNSE